MLSISRFAVLTAISAIAVAQSLTFTEYQVPTANSRLKGIASAGAAIWFTEPGSFQIGHIGPPLLGATAAISETPVPHMTASAADPQYIAAGPDSTVWFTLQGGIDHRASSGSITDFGSPGGASNFASFIARGADGNMWFTDTGTVAVGRITPDGQITEFPLPNAPGAVQPGIRGIALGPDEALWFVDALNRSIGRITTDGIVTEFPVPNLATAAGNASIVEGRDLALWFADGNLSIGRITTNGTLTEYPVGVTAGGLAVGRDGNIWFTSQTSNQIGRITLAGSVTLFDAPAMGSGITSGPDGAMWYAAPAANQIVRFEVPSRVGALAQIVSGGGWDTTITLLNLGGASVSSRLAFYGDNGAPLTLNLTVSQNGVSENVSGAFVDRAINPNATVTISTSGATSMPMSVGWGDLTSTGPVQGYAILRQTSQTAPPSSGTVPIQSQGQALPYDNTNGLATGVALANLSLTAVNITGVAWDESGALLGQQTIAIPGNGHTSFVLADRMPVTAGKRGIVGFSDAPGYFSGLLSPNGGIALLGLRFDPIGTFTSIPPASMSGALPGALSFCEVILLP
jgi:virginiamycin B lyase